MDKKTIIILQVITACLFSATITIDFISHGSITNYWFVGALICDIATIIIEIEGS